MPRGDHGWFERIDFQEAEKIAGERLDRRRQYYKHSAEGKAVDNPYAFNGSDGMPNAKLFTYGEWVSSCSGCSEWNESCPPDRGAGCRECGGTGRRRHGMHTPVSEKESSND